MKALKIILTVILSIAVILSLLVAGINGAKFILTPEFHSTVRNEGEIPGLDDGFIPQGFCRAPDGFLVSGYMNDGTASRVYLIRDDGEVTYTRLLDDSFNEFTGHAGGVSFFDDFIYIAGKGGIYVFYYEDIYDGLEEAEYYAFYRTFLNAAWCTVYDGMLYTGSFHSEPKYTTDEWQHVTTPAGDENAAMITVFKLDANVRYGIKPRPICIISAPDKIQGVAFTNDGIVLSTSQGPALSTLCFHKFNRNKYDYTLISDDDTTYEVPIYWLDSSTLKYEMKAPAMSEGIFYMDGRIYVMSESASEKYLFGKLCGGEYIYSFEAKSEYFE